MGIHRALHPYRLVVVLALILTGLALNSPGEIAAPPVTAESIRGDVDGDGRVNSIDAFHLIQFSAGIILPDPDAELYEKADLNNDGLLDSLDASLILQFHAGLIESL